MEKERYQITFHFKDQNSLYNESMNAIREFISSEVNIPKDQIDMMLTVPHDVQVECKRINRHTEEKN